MDTYLTIGLLVAEAIAICALSVQAGIWYGRRKWSFKFTLEDVLSLAPGLYVINKSTSGGNLIEARRFTPDRPDPGPFDRSYMVSNFTNGREIPERFEFGISFRNKAIREVNEAGVPINHEVSHEMKINMPRESRA